MLKYRSLCAIAIGFFALSIIMAVILVACKPGIATADLNEKVDFGDSIKFYPNPDRKKLSQIEKIELALKLDSITGGFDGVEIRIWLGHLMAIKKHLVILKQIDADWNCTVVSYSNIDPNRNSMTIKILDYRKVIPKSGWDTFLHSTEWNRIQPFLETGDSINCCGMGGTDGIVYDFEIAKKNQFNWYYYSNPADDSGKNALAGNIIKFASLLENEFGFEYTK